MDRKWWTLLAACTATFMLLLDITIVNVALPDIQKDLGSSFSDLQWVVDAYALMLASLLLTAGSLGDILGRRLVFAGGLVLFTAASLTCALASSPLFLNLSRGAQGVGGAILLATSLALIAQAFQGRERGTAFGIWGATIGFAVAVGPLVGGALTEYLGWQWIFYINLPIGIFTLIVTLLRVPEAYQRFGASIDWPGVATWTASLFLLVFALIRGNDEGWSSPQILGLFAGWAALLVAFVLIERAQEYPMLELRLFRIPTFTGGAIVAFTIAASMFAMFLYLTLYLQNVLGISPLGTGLRFLPLSMISFFVAAAAGAALRTLSGTPLPRRRARRHRHRARAHAGPLGRIAMDGAAARLLSRRGRDRAREPTARVGLGRRRGAVDERHGVGDQQHVQAGRGRDRHRRPGGDLPGSRDLDRPGRPPGGARGRRDADRPCGCERLGEAGDRGGPAVGPGCDRTRGSRRVRLRPEPDPRRRGDRRVRGRGRRLRARAAPGLRAVCQSRRRTRVR